MIWQPRNKLPATPLAVAALLALGLIAQSVLPWATELPPPPPPARGRPAVEAPTVGPLAQSVDIQRRTMFAPSRTFLPAVPGASGTVAGGPAGAGSDPVAGLTLIGSARTRNVALGLFRDSAGRTRSLRVGESYEGWRLVAVNEASAVLSRAGLSRTLRLGVPLSSAGTVAAMADIGSDEEVEQE